MDRRKAISSITLGSLSAVLSPAILSALNSCTSSYDPGYEPITFSATQDQLISRLVDIIIPATETPGAVGAGVNQYIDKVLSRVEDKNTSKEVLYGLDTLAKEGFLELSDAQQTEKLHQMEKSKSDFFRILKSMTIFGYYTSEIGASQELKYVHNAGTYRGDVPYDEVGRNYY